MVFQVFRTPIAVAAFLALAPALGAQSTQPVASTTSSDEQQTQPVPLPGTVTTVPTAASRAPWWELVGGYEGDNHDTAYGFFGPSFLKRLSDNVRFKAGFKVSHLHYGFANGLGGRTEVNSPGIGPSIGLRFGRKNWVQVSTGLDVDRERRQITDRAGNIVSSQRQTELGMSLGLDGWLTPSRRSNVHAMLHYGTASNYTWGRVAAKHQVTNFSWRGPLTFYLGAEGIGQGNADITSWQGGGLLEMLIHRSELSLQARGGYKRSTFDVGPDKTGPYFGVGLWKRF